MFFETFESPWIFERKMQRWGSLPSRWSVLRWRMRTRPPPSRWRGSCRRRRRRTWRRRSRCSSLPCKGSIRWFCYKSRSGVISWIYMYLCLVKADSCLKKHWFKLIILLTRLHHFQFFLLFEKNNYINRQSFKFYVFIWVFFYLRLISIKTDKKDMIIFRSWVQTALVIWVFYLWIRVRNGLSPEPIL